MRPCGCVKPSAGHIRVVWTKGAGGLDNPGFRQRPGRRCTCGRRRPGASVNTPKPLTNPNRPLPLARSEFSDDDPRRIREQLQAVYGHGTHVDCTGGQNLGRYRHVRHSATGFDVDQTDHSGEATLTIAEIGYDTLIWVHAGTLVVRLQDEVGAASRGEMRLLRAASGPVSLQTVDSRLTIVHLRSALPRCSSSPVLLDRGPRTQPRWSNAPSPMPPS